VLAALVAIPFGPVAGRASTTSFIVFSADRAPTVTGEIYRLDASGHLVDLSKSPYQDTNPAVSSDGKRVAFVSGRGGTAAVYEVGIDGRGLVRVGPSLAPLADAGCTPVLAWEPHGHVLAVSACADLKGRLWIVPRGRKPLRHQRNAAVETLSWSPDGRVLVASPFAGVVRAFSAVGHPLWKVKGGCCGSWSPQGLFAVAADHQARVYDESGRLRFGLQLPVRAARFSWSPDGRYVALGWSGNASWLEVLSATGKREFTRRVPSGDLAWAGNSTVVVGYPQCPACGKTVGFDARTGKETRASNRWLDPLSPDRKLAIVTPPVKPGTPFTLGVAPPGGGRVKRYARVGGCLGDGVWMPAASSLQFAGRSRSLVYQSWNDCDAPFANLYSMGAGGGGVTRLTNVQAQETQPAISPDGSEIAYVRADATGLSCKGCSDGIRIASAGGAELRTLTNPEDCVFDDSPSWSPDGSTILYSETGCDSPGELYTVPAAGGSPHDLGVKGSEPAWGPSKIAYVGTAGLWTANPDGSNPVEVAAAGNDPAWSEDGRLAYRLGRTGPTVVVGSTSVTLPFAEVTSLAWSPDGTQFVVTARPTKSAPLDVYTVRTAGTDPVRLTTDYDTLGAGWR
jgi:Tol biopolymer transport system component